MSTPTALGAQRDRYTREAILSATPARLLTMLYDRLVLDLERAEAAQLTEDWAVASEHLLHAQAIVTELASSLDVDAWDGADGLLGIYTYVTNALISANVQRDARRTRESLNLLLPLRDAWYEAAESLPAASATVRPAAAGAERGELGIA